jgi:hypothetical protein
VPKNVKKLYVGMLAKTFFAILGFSSKFLAGE